MKNPAVLWYPSDFISSTIFWNNEQCGAYIRLLNYQFTVGHLTKEQIEQITTDEVVIKKFIQDEEGLYYNQRMEKEIEKRSKYCESRGKNRNKVDNDNTCIYLMIDKINNYTKIGSSNHPERRLLEVQKYYKNKSIELYAYCENKPQKLEKELHDKYKDKWCFDEWYNLSKKDQEEIIKNNDMTNHMINDMTNHMGNGNGNGNENININDNFNIIDYFNNNIHSIARKEYEMIESWEETYTDEIIKEAIDIAVLNNAKSMNYINAILVRWKEKGYKNLTDIRNEKKKEDDFWDE
jgi:DnaD/phage-associated family protein